MSPLSLRGIINHIRAFLLERGVAVRQGLRFLRAEFSPRRPRCCLLAWYGSLKVWPKSGAGSMTPTAVVPDLAAALTQVSSFWEQPIDLVGTDFD
jgi:hypothetical protein